MLALVTYKNLFPRDFADLQLNKGFVHAIFSNKEKFCCKEIERINNEIQELEERIKNSEDRRMYEEKKQYYERKNAMGKNR